jgi:hypothetical protein
MFSSKILRTVVVLIVLCWSGAAFAAHPLITDDAGTQGKGKWQVELNGEYSHDNQNSANESELQIAATLTYGAGDNLDVAVGVPYLHLRAKEAGESTSASGVGDIPIYAKWRFYEKDGLSFALKPGITLPAGDEEKELGTGKVTYSIFLITTREAKPWAFHLNLGYIRNENKADEVKDLWHASLATEFEAAKGLRLVANGGIEHTRDRDSRVHPAFILGGLIYSITENFDVDFGIKGGLNKAEPDYTLLAGMTWRF